LRDNRVRMNDRANFAEEGTTAAAIPPGAGILVLGLPDVEVRDNTIEDQSGPGIFVASYEIFELLSGAVSDDPDTDKWTRRVYIHGNEIADTGTDPMGDWGLLGDAPLPGVVWDGTLAPGVDSQADMEICLGEAEQADFVKGETGGVGGVLSADTRTSDTSDHECELDPIEEQDF